MKPRREIEDFNKIPNVGPATTRYLIALGISTPSELIGQDPYVMYEKLCEVVVPEKLTIPCISTNLRCFWRV